MQINCLSCGHGFNLGKNYDDYEGYVKCSTCAGLLDIKTEDGDVKRVRPGAMPAQAATAMHSVPPPEFTNAAPPAQTASGADDQQSSIEDMRRTIAELQKMLAATASQQPADASSVSDPARSMVD